jgi:hypothetical protein
LARMTWGAPWTTSVRVSSSERLFCRKRAAVDTPAGCQQQFDRAGR